MKFNQSFTLPKDEIPATTVSVVITQSGQVFLVKQDNMPLVDLMGVLSVGIQNAAVQQKQADLAAETRIVKPGGLGAVPINGNGRSH